MAELDPITIDFTRYKLDGIADEMQATLLKSSFSPIVERARRRVEREEAIADREAQLPGMTTQIA